MELERSEHHDVAELEAVDHSWHKRHASHVVGGEALSLIRAILRGRLAGKFHRRACAVDRIQRHPHDEPDQAANHRKVLMPALVMSPIGPLQLRAGSIRPKGETGVRSEPSRHGVDGRAVEQ